MGEKAADAVVRPCGLLCSPLVTWTTCENVQRQEEQKSVQKSPLFLIFSVRPAVSPPWTLDRVTQKWWIFASKQNNREWDSQAQLPHASSSVRYAVVPGKRLARQPRLPPFGTPKAATQHCLSSGEVSVLNFGSVLSREPASFHSHVGSLAHFSHHLLHQSSQLTAVCCFLFAVNFFHFASCTICRYLLPFTPVFVFCFITFSLSACWLHFPLCYFSSLS